MRLYTFGKETVPVAGISMEDGILIIGSVKNENYKIMLLKLNYEEELEWFRFFGGKNDWEGHSIAKLADDYLIGGAVEGVATPEGGEGWKAYVARLDEGLNVLWELKLNVRNNGAVYSILPTRGGFFIAGETGGPGNKGFFIGEVSPRGELSWLKDFGSWEDAVFTALLQSESGLKLIGSVREERWKVKSFDFSNEGELLHEETLAEGIALTADLWRGKLVLAGYRGENFWVRIGEHDFELGEGSATSLLPAKDRLLVGGELGGKAVVVDVSGERLNVRELWGNGWVEVLGEGLVVGVKEEKGKVVTVVETL